MVVGLTIDGLSLSAEEGATILEVAQSAGVYIPALCHHPDLPSFETVVPSQQVFRGNLSILGASEEKYKGCGVCLVEIEGEGFTTSCNTPIREGMVISTNTPEILSQRQNIIGEILLKHPHACGMCPQSEGCNQKQCISNVPEDERCCENFIFCELRKLSIYIGIKDDLPRYKTEALTVVEDEPLFIRNYNLCINCTRCVRACNDVRGVGALAVTAVGGKFVVGTKAPTLKESGCKFCGACVEVCPTGALTDKSVRPGKKAEDLVPCKEACPAHIDIPGYLRLIAQGRSDEALSVIREKVPLPGVLGRVCIHPCEDVCRRKEVSEAISICALKRYAADKGKGSWKKKIKTNQKTGKKVAIVGSGPAGLTAAFYLRKQGHDVVVFEAQSKAGGMLRYGIPKYRLPEDILDGEIKDIFDLGIDFRPNQIIGKDIPLDQLKKNGYDAVFIGAGAQLSRRIPVEGAELPDVLWGVDFLRQVADGKTVDVKGKVIVIGGGNVAVDVALTVLRCGAKDVTMACLECEEEMPAHKWEIEGAVAEGVKLMPSWGPHRILKKNGKVSGMELVQCTSVFDEKRSFCPMFGDEKIIVEADQVIMAIGQASDLSFLNGSSSVASTRGLIVIDANTLETGMKGFYAGGDVAFVPGAVIHAVAAGRKAASSIDIALGGDGNIDEDLFDGKEKKPFIGRDEGFALWPRERVDELDVDIRKSCFREVSLGYDSATARKEASRCLQCDLRLEIASHEMPPEKWLEINDEHLAAVPADTEGVFQLYAVDKKLICIKGAMSMREELKETIERLPQARYFIWEEETMYAKRESELLQQYLQQHGGLPEGNSSELDDDLY